jgi:DNA topoisomerase-1
VEVNGNRLRGQANFRIFAGWEALDGERANASERGEEESFRHREILLPEVVIGNELNCIEVKIIENETRRPPRYGIGRFLTTLDSKGIARPSTLDTIIRNLTGKEYVTIHQGMLYCTELGKEVDDWTTEKAPWLNDVEHARIFEERLDRVERSDEGRDTVIAEYVERVEALKESLGFQDKEGEGPSEDQLSYAQRLAEAASVQIPAAALADRAALSAFISAHRPRKKSVGKCPACRTAKVISHEKLFSCERRECDFKLWRSGVTRFADHFIDGETNPDDLVRELLRRKKTLIEGLRSSKGNVFDAYVGIAPATEGEHWQIEFMGYPRKPARASFS